MAERGDAKFLQVGVGELGDKSKIDTLAEPMAPDVRHLLHRGSPGCRALPARIGWSIR